MIEHEASRNDYLPRDTLREMQSERLCRTVRRAYEKVELYRRRMEEHGLHPDDIRSLDDISRLPFTVKRDLRDKYPFGMFATSLADVVRLHASSGTTGKPIVVAYTQGDLNVWSNAIQRTLVCYGLHRGDVIQVAYGYGLFTGGLGFHYGAEALGATVIPASAGNTERQLMVMKDFGVTAICCTPSYFLHLAEQAQEMDLNLHSLPLRVGAFGAEPWTEAMRLRIQRDTAVKAYDVYGLTEIVGPGVAAECRCQNGLHIFEDHFYPEVIDPQTLQPVAEGQEGELVITTLTKEAMPMIRYRTRDITSLVSETCACGRTLRRMRRVSRRTDDMFTIRGVNVYPSQIETALLAAEGTLPHYQIVLTRRHELDEMEVQVEVTAEVFTDRVRALEDLQARLAAEIEHVLGLRAAVRLVGPHSIERSQGKARRVIDQRGIV
jgi:phenylacetate-CoA ligase